MTFYAISALVNAVTSSFLGTFVLYKKRTRANVYFFLFSLSVALWSLSYFIWQISSTANDAVLWLKILTDFSAFIPFFYFKFTITFLGIANKILNKIIAYIGILLVIFFITISPTRLMVFDVTQKLSFKFWPDAGDMYWIFIYMFGLFAAYSMILYWKAYKKEESRDRKAQIKFLLLGTGLGFFGGATNFPLWFDIPIPPFGNILVSLYVLFTAYAILKYHLLNIKILTAQFVSLTIVIVSFVQVINSRDLTSFFVNVLIFIALVILAGFLIHNIETENKRKEELQFMADKLSRANDQLRKLDNAKSEFISIASHQLRTPLTAIKGFLSLLLEGSYGKIEKDKKDVLNKVYLSNERLISLVEDLLNLSRIESGRMQYDFEKVDIIPICKEIYDTFVIRAKERKLKLECEKPKGKIPEVMTDRNKIREVVSNLVDNAIKYTPKGSVTIRIKLVDDHVQISVADTGIGVPKEELPYLFQKFSRGKDVSRLNTGGTGLGLHVGKRIIENLHGKVWIESPGANQGSTFIVELPTNLTKEEMEDTTGQNTKEKEAGK